MGEGAKQSEIDYDEVMRRMSAVSKAVKKSQEATAKIGAAMMNYLINYDEVTRRMSAVSKNLETLKDLKKNTDEVEERVREALKDLKKNTDEVEERVRETVEYLEKALSVKEK